MKKFKFYQDVKVTTWKRQPFFIEAENEDEAIEKARNYGNHDVTDTDDIELGEEEEMKDFEETVHPCENGGWATMMVCNENEDIIAGNVDNIETYNE